MADTIITADEAREHLTRLRDALLGVRESVLALGAHGITISHNLVGIDVLGCNTLLDSDEPGKYPSLGHVSVSVDGAWYDAKPAPAVRARALRAKRDALDAEIAALGGAS